MPRSATNPTSASIPGSVVPITSPSLTRNQIRGFWASGADGPWMAWIRSCTRWCLCLRCANCFRVRHPPPKRTSVIMEACSLPYSSSVGDWPSCGDRSATNRPRSHADAHDCVVFDFTFLSAFVTGVWQLAIWRLLAGIGIGGEWAMGGTFVAEEWPENRRTMGAGLMHTGYYVGIFLAALANYGIGQPSRLAGHVYCRRFTALFLAWIRHGLFQPVAWKKRNQYVRSWAIWRPFAVLFSPQWRRRTILNSLFMLASICGLWAGTVYVPTAITALANRRPHRPARATGILGRHVGLRSPPFWDVWPCPGWRNIWDAAALAVFFSLMVIFIALTFGVVSLGPHALPWFFVCLFFLGVRWREFCRLYALASRAISHRIPGQCFWFQPRSRDSAEPELRSW